MSEGAGGTRPRPETGMATDLEASKATSKPDAFLERKFAELCGRIHRIDCLHHFLTLTLVVIVYALLRGWFDFFISNAQSTWAPAIRWVAYLVFLGFAAWLFVRLVRAGLRRVNRYYVAHLLESTVPDGKNSLINWLDMQDEDLPGAFRKNLSARAAEQLDEADLDQVTPRGKNWVLMGLHAIPMLGLFVLFVLGPLAFFASMLHAFFPFFTPTSIARTQIALVQPKGDIEVHPGETVTFIARIDGRVPAANRKDAPKLHYRYQSSEDYFTQPLEQAADGTWTTQLLPERLRTGFTYKLSAGDAETTEHQVRVRARAHVQKLDVTYHHRPYRQPATTKISFPNQQDARPSVRGVRGTEVELIVHASRPVQSSSVELRFKNAKQTPNVHKVADDPHAFTCRFTLEQSGEFRIAFSTTDREENGDRDAYPIEVRDDEAPRVVLNQPGKDVTLPENGFLELAGFASDDFGVKKLALHVRVVEGPAKPALAPIAYRPEAPLKFDDGGYPTEVAYSELLQLDQLKDDRSTTQLLPAGTVLEYWLEATDNADYPPSGGNVGKSAPYKITLARASVDPKQKENRRAAIDRQKKQKAEQDQMRDQENKQRQQKQDGGGNGGGSNPQDQLNALNKEKQKTEEAIKNAADQQNQNQERGGAKGSDQNNSSIKEGPGDGSDGPPPQAKDQPPASPEDTGNAKDQGDKPNSGDSKDGGDKKSGPSQPGNTKGIEQQGPETPSKGQGNDADPTKSGANAKGGMMSDAGDSKDAPKQEGSGPGQARDDEPRPNPRNPSWDQMARLIEQLPQAENGTEVAKALAEIAKSADDARKRELASDALIKNGRDPKTGNEQKKKAPNPVGTGGKSPGLSDDVKAAIANREFAAKIGQMQLDDWKKQMTPELLKKAGLTEADWQRYLKNRQAHDALVRQLNAKLIREGTKELRGTSGPGNGGLVPTVGAGNSTTDEGDAGLPPELRDVLERLSKRKMNP